MDSKNAKMIPVEDNDVARERELIHSKPLAVLQLDNNLVIKWLHSYLSNRPNCLMMTT